MAAPNLPKSGIQRGAGQKSHKLFDFQINGFAGVDFQSEGLTGAQLRHAVDALERRGVAGILLTLITASESRLIRQLQRIEALRRDDAKVARLICGYHLEGPWIRKEAGFCGAHPMRWISAPSLKAFERFQAAAGSGIRLVTLAPEWPHSREVIAGIVEAGVNVALGHTNASEAEIDQAIEAGARFCTHLGNGVPAMLPRHDNVVQRLLARDELTACFIPDGVHLPFFALRNFFRAKPAGRVLFTTDAMAGAGMPPGRYALGDLDVVIGQDGVARNGRAGGGLAGSTLTPDRGVELTAKFLAIDMAESYDYWSRAPIEALGLRANGGLPGEIPPPAQPGANLR